MVVFASICWSFFSSKGDGGWGRSRKREGGKREAVVERSRFGVSLSLPSQWFSLRGGEKYIVGKGKEKVVLTWGRFHLQFLVAYWKSERLFSF